MKNRVLGVDGGKVFAGLASPYLPLLTKTKRQKDKRQKDKGQKDKKAKRQKGNMTKRTKRLKDKMNRQGRIWQF